MKKILTSLSLIATLALPVAASAHEHDSFMIGTSTYQIVIGSLNEPVAVDDKTGVDLTVTKGSGMPTMSPDGDMDGPARAATPVLGLESSLKVELEAGGNKKLLTLNPQYGKPGAYTAAFYPTIATTLAYHVIGIIEGNAVDLTFTCIPEGVTKAADDSTPLKISESVTRLSHGGGFGCPVEKEDLGFPEQSSTLNNLMRAVGSAQTISYGAGAVALIALAAALIKKRS